MLVKGAPGDMSYSSVYQNNITEMTMSSYYCYIITTGIAGYHSDNFQYTQWWQKYRQVSNIRHTSVGN